MTSRIGNSLHQYRTPWRPLHPLPWSRSWTNYWCLPTWYSLFSLWSWEQKQPQFGHPNALIGLDRLRSAGVVTEWPWLMYCFTCVFICAAFLSHGPFHLVDRWNQSGRDPCWFSLAVFCWLEWYLRSDSTLRCLGGRQLWLTRSVPASRSSVHAPSRLLLCGCAVDLTQLCAQTSARPAHLAVCSDKLSSAKRYLYYQRNQPMFPCTGWVELHGEILRDQHRVLLKTIDDICPGCILVNHAQLVSLPGMDSVTCVSCIK